MKRATTVSAILSWIVLLPLTAFAGGGHEHGTHEHGHDEHEAAGIAINEEVLKDHGVEMGVAGPAELSGRVKVSGRISANQDKLAHIHPRFPGIVKEVRKSLGDTVAQGELLAIIESNQSLQRYEVVSLTSGTVIFRHATVGEFVTESEPIYIVADLTQLWVDLFIFPRDFASVSLGQKVKIRPPYAKEPLESNVSFVSQLVDEATQARIARAVVDNKEGRLYPDEYVDAEILHSAKSVPLAVKSSALQTIGASSVVFIRREHGFEAVQVITGESDGEHTAVLKGLTPGARYAFGNTYLLKAELGKGSAVHEH